MRSDRGYSLVEMLIVVGLIGIVTAISVPVFLESNARSRLWTGSEEIGAAIRQARLRAISSNTNYRVVFDCPSAGELRSLIMTGDPAVDDGADRCNQTLDGDSGTHAMPTGVDFDPDGATSLAITGRGAFTANGAAIPLTISVTHGSTARTLTVSATGQITFSDVQ
ncbi:MAG: GspH/FimT family pseudopilin [Acidobacteriota bacterium]|nr:GspH/FimT family pseudopilin [Acidobacteriota bacterium]